MNGRRRNGISATFWALGMLVSALSVASLVQRWGDIGLNGIVASAIAYYQRIAQSAREVLFDWWTLHLGVQVPDWFIDVLAIWLVAGGSLIRAQSAAWARRTEAAMTAPSPKEVETRGFHWSVYLKAFVAGPIGLLFSIFRFVQSRREEQELDGASSGFYWQADDASRQEVAATYEHYRVARDEARWSAVGSAVLPFIGAVLFLIWGSIQL